MDLAEAVESAKLTFLIARSILRGVEEKCGVVGIERKPDTPEGFPLGLQSIWHLCLKYAERRYPENPERSAIDGAWNCAFVVLRENFLQIEPILRSVGNWRRGVPFERILRKDPIHFQLLAILNEFDYRINERGETLSEKDFNDRLWNEFIEPMRAELIEFECAIDAIIRQRERKLTVNELQTVGDSLDGREKWPPDQGWHFKPGFVWFRGCRYEITAKCKKLLEKFLKWGDVPIERPDLFKTAWPDDVVGDDALRQQLSKLRLLLIEIAKDIDADENVIDDPLPHKDGGWRFLLPVS